MGYRDEAYYTSRFYQYEIKIITTTTTTSYYVVHCNCHFEEHRVCTCVLHELPKENASRVPVAFM